MRVTMSSKIEQLIDELENYIEECKPRFMSNSEIIVNRETIDDLIREIRMKTPDEIKRYQKIISNKDAILNDARMKAEALIAETTAHTTELINEHEIMQQAYAQANEVVTMASRQAQEILDNATLEANSVRTAAMEYMDEMLEHLENIIVSSSQTASVHYEGLIDSLNQYKDVIQSNRNELHPIETELEEMPVDPEHNELDDIDSSDLI